MGMGLHKITLHVNPKCCWMDRSCMTISKRYDTYMFVLKYKIQLLNPIYWYGVKITPYMWFDEKSLYVLTFQKLYLTYMWDMCSL